MYVGISNNTLEQSLQKLNSNIRVSNTEESYQFIWVSAETRFASHTHQLMVLETIVWKSGGGVGWPWSGRWQPRQQHQRCQEANRAWPAARRQSTGRTWQGCPPPPPPPVCSTTTPQQPVTRPPCEAVARGQRQGEASPKAARAWQPRAAGCASFWSACRLRCTLDHCTKVETESSRCASCCNKAIWASSSASLLWRSPVCTLAHPQGRVVQLPWLCWEGSWWSHPLVQHQVPDEQDEEDEKGITRTLFLASDLTPPPPPPELERVLRGRAV